MALTPKLERQVLENKIEHIDKRRAEIEVLLGQPEAPARMPGAIPTAGGSTVRTYRRSELETELRTLGAERRVTANKLATLDAAPDSQADDGRRRFLDAKEAESRANLERNIRKFEREGDYRSARLYRQELLNLRRRLEEQYS